MKPPFIKIAACGLWTLQVSKKQGEVKESEGGVASLMLTGRLEQMLFAIVVLGLSSDRVKSQVFGDTPTTIKYSVFTGGFGMIICAVGIVAVFFEMIPLLGVLAADALSAIFFLAGGIVSLLFFFRSMLKTNKTLSKGILSLTQE